MQLEDPQNMDLNKLRDDVLEKFDPESFSILDEAKNVLSGASEKLKILSFFSPRFLGPPVGIFATMFNPESYQITSSVEYSESMVEGGFAKDPKFVKIPPNELSITFTMDGTGASSKKIPVPAQVKLFQAVTGFDGIIHKPRYLMLNWGTLIFPCVLASSTINYTLFSPQGIPLRAKVTASFREYVPRKKSVLDQGNKSADLTHIRVVKAGDTLPLLCKQVYDDESVYIEVAKANNLTNFRKLTVGQELKFPPLVNE